MLIYKGLISFNFKTKEDKMDNWWKLSATKDNIIQWKDGVIRIKLEDSNG